VIVKDNDEVMIEWRERIERVCALGKKVSQGYLMFLSVCLCIVRVCCMSSSREETESPICLQPLHQVSLVTLIYCYVNSSYHVLLPL